MGFTIKRPLVTEKNSALAEQGIYVFEVEHASTKPEVKVAVEKFFKVKVLSVRTAICRKRKKAVRGLTGTVRYWKKAFVQLAPGEKIALFEGA